MIVKDIIFSISYSSFSDEDFKLYAVIWGILLVVPVFCIILLFILGLGKEGVTLLGFCIPISFLVLIFSYSSFFWNCPILKEKYDFFKDSISPWGINPQFNTVLFYYLSYGLVLCGLSLGYFYSKSNLFFALGVGLSFIQGFLMYWRLDVFSSKNVDFYIGVNGETKILGGYGPQFYFLISVLTLIRGYPWGLLKLQECFLYGNLNQLLFVLLWLLIFVFLHFLLVFPYKVNNLIPFDLRIRYYGSLYLICILLVLIFLSVFLKPLFFI